MSIDMSAAHFTALSRAAASWPDSRWMPILREGHRVVGGELPPLGVPVLVRYPNNVGMCTRVVDVFGSTWLGVGVASPGKPYEYPDAWAAIPE